MMRCVSGFVLFVLWIAAVVVPSNSSAHTKVFIPFQIQEALPRVAGSKEYKTITGLKRRKEPVTITVTLPGDFDMPLYGANQFALVTLDPTVKLGPSQMKVMTRWTYNNVIQWLQIDTIADVAANKSNNSLTMVIGVNKEFPALGKDNGDSFSIDTGAAVFTIRKKDFNLLDKVVVDGKTLVAEGASEGLVLTGADGTEFFASKDSKATVKLEENGPVKVVIVAKGSFFSKQGKRNLDYTVRMHFYKGKSRVRTFVTLRNASKKQLENVQFKALELRIKTTLKGASYLFNTHAGEKSGKLTASDAIRLFQGENNTKTLRDTTVDSKFWPTGIKGYTLKQGDKVLAQGTREQPIRLLYAQIKGDDNSHVTMGTRFAAQWWPQGLGVDGDGTVRHGVFPAGNDKLYIIRFGTHETREVMWRFGKDENAAKDDFFRFQYPLISKPQDPGWFNQIDIAWMRVSSFLEEQDYNLNLQYPINKTPYDTANRRPDFQIPRFVDWSLVNPLRYFDPGKVALVNYWRQEKLFAGGYYLASEQRAQYYADRAVFHSDDFDVRKLASEVPGLVDAKTGGVKSALELPNGDKLPNVAVHFTRTQHHAHLLRSMYWQSGDVRLLEAYKDWGEKVLVDAGKGSTLTGHAWDLYHLTDLFRATGAKEYKDAADKVFTAHFGKTLADGSVGQDKQRGFLLAKGTKKTALSILEQGALVPRALMYYHDFATRSSTKKRNPDTLLGDRVRDVVMGMVRFVAEETFVKKSDKVGEFGNPATYNVDAPKSDPTSDKGWNAGIQGIYLTYFFGYLLSSDPMFLEKGKLLLKTTAFNTPNVYWYQDLPGRQNLQYLIDYPILLARWRDLPLDITFDGKGSATLKWVVPFDPRSLWFKMSDKPIVPSYQYDPATGKFKNDPKSHTVFFAAKALPNKILPKEPNTLQSVTVKLPDGKKKYYFAARYFSIDPRPPITTEEWVPSEPGEPTDAGEVTDTEPGPIEKVKEPSGDAGSVDSQPDITTGGCSGCQTGEDSLPTGFLFLGLLLIVGWSRRRRS